MSTYRNTFVAQDTFEAGPEERRWVGSKHYPEGIVVSNGTVEVRLQGRVRRLPALREANGAISVRGVSGRYRTGGKAWPAQIDTSPDGATVYVWFGRDDRSGKFNKASGLFFAE
jgi:hypothetical protein